MENMNPFDESEVKEIYQANQNDDEAYPHHAPERREMQTCTWTYDDMDDYWETSCGEQFMITEGTPKENKMIYCHYCGKKIKEVMPK